MDRTLEGIDWRLTHGVSTAAGQPITARFVDGTLSGQGPVNRYRSVYERDGSTLRIGPPSLTRTAGTPDAMAVESAYGRLLGAVAGFAGDDRSLELRDAGGTAILRFERAPSGLSAIAGPWTVRAVRRGEGMVSAPEARGATMDFDAVAGTVSGSAGINRLHGTAEIHDGRVRFGPLALTRMAGEPDAMDAEAAFVSALEDVTGMRVDGDRLTLLDQDGEPLVELVRGG
ncbi:MAG TPA: META domain-containing protein [Candidatus Saccharimonadales bacterium]|nr:META domain-containing protein [Candidatus Saccharimonadales bacterium]